MPSLGDLKEVAKVLRAADKINEYQIILDAQEKLLEYQQETAELKKEIERLKEIKKFVFAEGKTYLIDPDYSDRHLCPVHTKEAGFEVPLLKSPKDYCIKCKQYYK